MFQTFNVLASCNLLCKKDNMSEVRIVQNCNNNAFDFKSYMHISVQKCTGHDLILAEEHWCEFNSLNATMLLLWPLHSCTPSNVCLSVGAPYKLQTSLRGYIFLIQHMQKWDTSRDKLLQVSNGLAKSFKKIRDKIWTINGQNAVVYLPFWSGIMSIEGARE